MGPSRPPGLSDSTSDPQPNSDNDAYHLPPVQIFHVQTQYSIHSCIPHTPIANIPCCSSARILDWSHKVKKIVLSEPKISETSLRQKLRNTDSIVAAVDFTNLLFRMSEAGEVELEKACHGSICVSPSLRTLREAKAREGPEQMIASSLCRTIPTQQLPGHLKEGSTISIVVTEVKSPGRFWFNLHEFTETPVYFEAAQSLMDRMQKFYAEEGDKWRVESVLDCQPGTVLAAQYSIGFRERSMKDFDPQN